jgi:hypothetical protein
LLLLSVFCFAEVGDMELDANLLLKGDGKKLLWYNGDYYISLRAPSTLAANFDLVWPAAYGDDGGTLFVTDEGILGWGQDVRKTSSPTYQGLTTISEGIDANSQTITCQHLQCDTIITTGKIISLEDATEGETAGLAVQGFRTGDKLRTMEIGVGADADDTASFDGVSTYKFKGAIEVNDITATKTLVDDGSVGSLSYSFTSDTDTGFYRSGSGSSEAINFTISGTRVGFFEGADGSFLTKDSLSANFGKIIWAGTAMTAQRNLTFDLVDGSRTFRIEDDAIINSDLSTDAAWETSSSITGGSLVTGGTVVATGAITGASFNALLLTQAAPGNLTISDGTKTLTVTENCHLDQDVGQGYAPSWATGVRIGNLTLADGSITDSSGAISFGDENLSTTGTFGVTGLTTTKEINVGNTTGTVPFIVTATISSDETVTIYNSNAPVAFRVIDMWSINTAATAGQWSLTDGTNTITVAGTVAVDQQRWPATGDLLPLKIDDDYHEIAEDGTLAVVNNAKTPAACIVYVMCMPI